jgi:hypothetical protein
MGQLIGTVQLWLISLFVLLCSATLFIAWANWSHRVIESLMHSTSITTSLLIGENIFTDVALVLVGLSLISEISLLIAATLKARSSR